MEGPFSVIRTVPKFNNVGEIFIKEQSKILQYSNKLLLIWMNRRIKDTIC